MKKTIFIFLTLGILGCQKHIKNEVAEVATDSEVVLEDISFDVPKANNNTLVNKREDLLGYWVGSFTASDEDIDGTSTDETGLGDYDTYKKLTFSIDEIKGLNVKGHSIISGNIRPFEGKITEIKDGFNIKVDEPGDDKYDGTFEFTIALNSDKLNGGWKVFKKENTKIDSRTGTLEKKIFKYDKEASLEYNYMDEENTKKQKYTYKDVDSTGKEYEETYEEQAYFATTAKIFEINPSTQKITDKTAQELSKGDILILRNLIFARHGYAFRDKKLRSYFDGFSWYMPIFSDVTKELTSLEKQNIKTLLRFEKNAKAYYDVFGR